jgi:hypothetical protein
MQAGMNEELLLVTLFILFFWLLWCEVNHLFFFARSKVEKKPEKGGVWEEGAPARTRTGTADVNTPSPLLCTQQHACSKCGGTQHAVGWKKTSRGGAGAAAQSQHWRGCARARTKHAAKTRRRRRHR